MSSIERPQSRPFFAFFAEKGSATNEDIRDGQQSKREKHENALFEKANLDTFFRQALILYKNPQNQANLWKYHQENNGSPTGIELDHYDFNKLPADMVLRKFARDFRSELGDEAKKIEESIETVIKFAKSSRFQDFIIPLSETLGIQVEYDSMYQQRITGLSLVIRDDANKTLEKKSKEMEQTLEIEIFARQFNPDTLISEWLNKKDFFAQQRVLNTVTLLSRKIYPVPEGTLLSKALAQIIHKYGYQIDSLDILPRLTKQRYTILANLSDNRIKVHFIPDEQGNWQLAIEPKESFLEVQKQRNSRDLEILAEKACISRALPNVELTTLSKYLREHGFTETDKFICLKWEDVLKQFGEEVSKILQKRKEKRFPLPYDSQVVRDPLTRNPLAA